MKEQAARRCFLKLISELMISLIIACSPVCAQTSYLPGHRTVTDAHNCYPYDGRWADRIDRALASGVPIAIEQDLNWYPGTTTDPGRVVVGHGTQHTAFTNGGLLTGTEPNFNSYFFDRIRPLVEEALRSKDHSKWPLITLNLDFKSEEPALLQAVWKILDHHRAWLTTATKTLDRRAAPLDIGPILVLNGPSEAQERVFYDRVAAGHPLLTFGAVHTDMRDPKAAATVIEVEPLSNYRRWWNNPWTAVEPEGQSEVGQWVPQSALRLAELVAHAHSQGLWIRFYTLDGATEAEQKRSGWFHQYNFPSQLAAEKRWHAAIASGVDFLATDQYEHFSEILQDRQP